MYSIVVLGSLQRRKKIKKKKKRRRREEKEDRYKDITIIKNIIIIGLKKLLVLTIIFNFPHPEITKIDESKLKKLQRYDDDLPHPD